MTKFFLRLTWESFARLFAPTYAVCAAEVKSVCYRSERRLKRNSFAGLFVLKHVARSAEGKN